MPLHYKCLDPLLEELNANLLVNSDTVYQVCFACNDNHIAYRPSGPINSFLTWFVVRSRPTYTLSRSNERHIKYNHFVSDESQWKETASEYPICFMTWSLNNWHTGNYKNQKNASNAMVNTTWVNGKINCNDLRSCMHHVGMDVGIARMYWALCLGRRRGPKGGSLRVSVCWRMTILPKTMRSAMQKLSELPARRTPFESV